MTDRSYIDSMIKTAARIVFVTAMAILMIGGIIAFSQNGQLSKYVYADSDKLQIVSMQSVYVHSGGTNIVSIQVKNNSDEELKGVNLYQGWTSIENCGKEGAYVDGSSTYESTDPIYGDKDSYYRFVPYFEEPGYAASNATWDSDEEGYTIAAGKTAKLWFKVGSRYEDTGTYNEWIKLGDVHTDLYSGIIPVTIVDEAYSGEMPVKVRVYNPSAAALTVGTKEDVSSPITPVSLGSTIDFGTINLSASSNLTQEKTIYTRNTTTISSTGKDEHGLSQNIKVDLSVETPMLVQWSYDYPFGSSSILANGSSWAPLEPATATEWMEAQTGITLDASNFIAGTYSAKLRLTTIPHGVHINGSSTVNTNGIYEWPVNVTFTGTNPRIPKAPININATAGNGQVELTWKAAAGAEIHTTYEVYRREGGETTANKANLSNASFNWSDYEYVGNDTADDEGSCLFVDGTVTNGKTYTYVIIGGTPYQAYPAISSSVTPKSSLTSKLQAPYMYGGSEGLGGNVISWSMNDNYGGLDNDGSSMVDHFNIYRDGVLIGQVQQNAVIEENTYGWHEVSAPTDEDPDATEWVNGIIRTEYTWEYFAETPVPNQDYTFNVAAVSKSGVEGYWSEDMIGSGVTEESEIFGHTATVEVNGSEVYAKIELRCNEYNSPEKVTYWRAEGTTAPDTTKTPIYTYSENGYSISTKFTDETVKKGKTYTYTAQVEDGEGNKSNFYTFRIKVADTTDWAYDIYQDAQVTWQVVDGKSAKMSWYASTGWDDNNDDWQYVGTYNVYRNGSMIKTFSPSGQSGGTMTVTDNPGTDGTYVYRVDTVLNGITIRGREYTFVRNTAKVDEDEFLKAPSAPIFDIRMSDGVPVLHWAPTDEGGEVEGYHIYRKDAGNYVNGRYYNVPPQYWIQSSWKYWNNKRYISITDPSITSLADTTDNGSCFMGDETKGELQNVSWDEDACPHEYWITAYNGAGESAPSQVFTFEFQGLDENERPIVPSNEDSYPPATPIIKDIWVEWDDTSISAWDESIGGELRVAWEDPETSISIDSWDVNYTGIWNAGSESLKAWAAAQDPDTKLGKGNLAPRQYVSAGNGSSDDYGKTASVTVTAKNSAGQTTSKAKTLKITSFPRSRVLPDNGKVKVEWTDLFEDTTTDVTGWEIWRKSEAGGWKTVKIFEGTLTHNESGKDNSNNDVDYYSWYDEYVTNGWTYQYKVVAKCSDGTDRPGVVRKVTPTFRSATVEPGAPQNLKATVVDGVAQLTWDPPTTGTAQTYHVMVEYTNTYSGERQWFGSFNVSAPSTSYVWDYDQADTYRAFVYATSYINGVEVPEGAVVWETENIDELYPNHSNIVEFTLTQDDIAQQPTDRPGAFNLTATPGDSQVTLNWTKSSGATSYEISRISYDDTDPTEYGTVTVLANETSYVDNTALPGARYRYTVTAQNYYYSIYNTVIARAEGKSKDQMIADDTTAAIDALPEANYITLENYTSHEDAANDAKDSYDSLTAEQKKLVPDEMKQKLSDVLDRIATLKALEKYREVIGPVQEQIDALPAAENITLDDEAAVVNARNAYDSLPAEAKQLLKEQLTHLKAAESKLAALHKAENDAAIVNEILTDIENLAAASAVSTSNAESVLEDVESIQARIRGLDADQKDLLNADANSEALEKLNETMNMAKGILGQPHEHILTHIDEIDPTCVAAGNISYYKCEACDKLFADGSGETEITEDQKNIPPDPTSHNWSDWTEKTPATCTADKTEHRTCSNCHTEEIRTVDNTARHNWVIDTIGNELVDDGNGASGYSISYRCTNGCGVQKTGFIYPGGEDSCDIDQHDWHEESRTPATCSAKGLIIYHCSKCSDAIKHEDDIDPNAHDWSEWANAENKTYKCTEDIIQKRTCSRCNAEQTRVIPATEDGQHRWDDGEITEEPSCGSAGIKLFRCTRCDETKSEIIPADPDKHIWGEWHTLYEADCTTAGQRMRECINDPSHFETEEIAVNGHSWGDWETVIQANCTEEGSEKRSCTIEWCDATETRDTDPTGHKWNGGVVIRAAGEGVTGIKRYTCTSCGTTRDDNIPAIVLPTDLPAVKIKKPSAAKKKFTAKWAKVSKKNKKKIGGIEIQVIGPNGYNRTFTAGKGKSSKKISGLLAKNKYSVRVRAYRWVGGVKHVSKWSGWKSVKTK